MARRPAATTRRAAAPRGRRKANTAPPQFGTHAYAVAFERVMRMVREASTPAEFDAARAEARRGPFTPVDRGALLGQATRRQNRGDVPAVPRPPAAPRKRRAAPRSAAPPRLAEPRAGASPNTVYYKLYGFPNYEYIGVISARHDGTIAGIREAAKGLQRRADQLYSHSHGSSQLIATGADGRAGWAISPNLAHIDPVGTDEARYTLGDLSAAPKPNARRVHDLARHAAPAPRQAPPCRAPAAASGTPTLAYAAPAAAAQRALDGGHPLRVIVSWPAADVGPFGASRQLTAWASRRFIVPDGFRRVAVSPWRMDNGEAVVAVLLAPRSVTGIDLALVREVRAELAVKSNGRLKRTKLACSRRGKALKRSGNKVAASRLAKLCPTRRRRAQR